MTRLVCAAMAQPTRLMLLTWILFALVFTFGPLDYFRDIKIHTWLAIAFSIVLFISGIFSATMVPIPKSTAVISPSRVNTAIMVTASVGIVGILLLAYDKVLLSGLDYTQGLAAVRFQRDIEVAGGIEVPRSGFLYLGYAVFSFGYCAVILFLLNAEMVRGLPAAAAQIAVASPIIYSLLYGGRAPMLLLVLLAGGAGLVRTLVRKPLLPRAHWIRPKLIALFLGLLLYNNYTWEERRQISSIEGYSGYLKVASKYWSLAPKVWVNEAVLDGRLPAQATMNILSNTLYLTHSVVTLDKMIEHRSLFSPYLGAYQIGIVSPIMRVFFPGARIVDRMTEDLQESGTFGWFPSAWGAWFMDLGAFGAMVAIFIWGLLSGLAYRLVRRRSGSGAQLLLSFALASVLVSPLNAPFGLSNSFLIFCAMVVTAWAMRYRITFRKHP